MKRKFYGFWALAGVAMLTGCAHPDPEAAATPATIQASTITAHATAVPTSIAAPGMVKAQFETQLAPKIAGRILSVNVHMGDAVTAGELIATLDPGAHGAEAQAALSAVEAAKANLAQSATAIQFQQATVAATIAAARSQVTQAQANLGSAEAKLRLTLAGPRPQEREQAHLAVLQAESALTLAKKTQTRYQFLAKQGAIAQQQLDAANADLAAKQAIYNSAIQAESIANQGSRQEDIDAAKEAVAEAKAAINTAKADLNAAIASRQQIEINRQMKQAAQANLAQASANAQAAGITLNEINVVSPVSGRVASRLADPGNYAQAGTPIVTIISGPLLLEASVPETDVARIHLGESLSVQVGSSSANGTVQEISPQGDAQSHTYLVKVALPPKFTASEGAFGTASIPVDSHKGILVPQSATFTNEGMTDVYVVDSQGFARLRIVTLGQRIGSEVEVLSGLNDGETIVSQNPAAVHDGDKINALGAK